MPVLAGTGGDQPAVAVIHHRVAGDFHQQHQRVEVAGQHHIAAAAQHHQRQALRARVGQRGQQVGFGANVGREARPDIETECIVPAQGIEFVEICHQGKGLRPPRRATRTAG
ncbi:hypothetical protein D3C72_1705190 [compost metagenome]